MSSAYLHLACSSVRTAALRYVHLIEVGKPSATCRSPFVVSRGMCVQETHPLGELQGQ
jgi:hypothetical protein